MRRCIAVCVTLASLLLAGHASAQEHAPGYLAQHLRPPTNALELRVASGYTQGFGAVAPGRSMADVAGAGLGVGVDVDYRPQESFSLGLGGQLQEFASQQNSAARGLAFDLGATFHLAPLRRGDPWLRVGTGYRLLWEVDPDGVRGASTLRHGFDLATLRVGYDVRVSEDVALAPVIGGDLDLFLWQAPGQGGGPALSSGMVGTFIYAGLQGRFDLTGSELFTAPPIVGGR